MQICFGMTPTTTIPTFLTDDFGDELCVIPGEHCQTDDCVADLRVVDPYSWRVLCASIMRVDD